MLKDTSNQFGINFAQDVPGFVTAPFIDLPDGTRMVYDAARGSYTSAELMAGNLQPGMGMSALAGSANGLTFGWGDEIAAGLGADPMTVARGQATTIAANRDHPIATTIGQIAGGASAIIPAAIAAPSMAAAAPAARIGAAALGAGAVSAVDGAGNAHNKLRKSDPALREKISGNRPSCSDEQKKNKTKTKDKT